MESQMAASFAFETGVEEGLEFDFMEENIGIRAFREPKVWLKVI